MLGSAQPVLNADQISLCTGPPTKEEILVHYPPKFSWNQLKTFVNSGDLGLLKRNRKLQKRYDDWISGIVVEYGSMGAFRLLKATNGVFKNAIVNYLLNHRLQWGRPDTLSLLTSTVVDSKFASPSEFEVAGDADPPPYFTWETPAKYVSVIQNDWPYSVPLDVEHTLIWTKVPIYHPDLVHESIKTRIDQDGLWGFTGNDAPPPSPSNLPACLPSLAEWGITMDKLIRSTPPTSEEAALIEIAGNEVHRYVKNRWPKTEWETAWFVNPPRLQSVPGLAHIHVFARQK